MIPTTATSSASTSPATSGAASNQQNFSTAMIGIASLILEGRAISEDEFQPPQRRPQSTTAHAYYKDLEFAGNNTNSGRQSPVRPSTSQAAAAALSTTRDQRHVINITTNPNVFACSSAAEPPTCVATITSFEDTYESPSFAAAESMHQRWTQKLCQLRQASPAATNMGRDCALYEQKIGSGSDGSSGGGEPELVSLSINADSANNEKGDFEIKRRIMLSRSNLSNSGGSSASSPGSTDNFLHSLQSLATTCLRGGSPGAEAGLRYASPCTSFGGGGSIGAPPTKYTVFRATPPRCSNPFAGDIPGSASSSGSGIQSPLPVGWTPAPHAVAAAAPAFGNSSAHSSALYSRREKFLRDTSSTSGRIAIPKTASSTGAVTTSSNTATALSSACPQQGPHCEQFLRKMGLTKSEIADVEDHYCDMSYINITCSRWRAYCLKMDAIISRGEPVCIEVYLGPAGHRILLEQWILTHKETVSSPTMTLTSLCSAIRSQLYFSQISAWCDLIKKSDDTIYDSGRVIFPSRTGTAGDLATTANSNSSSSTTVTANTPCTSPSANMNMVSPILNSVNALPYRSPRLNIFYRIKQYDSTACFNSKPNVHNFPSVIITEGCSLMVCLKSLPRINGGIPKLCSTATLYDSSAGPSAVNGIIIAGCSTKAAAATETPSAFAGVVSPHTTTITPKTSRHILTTVTTSSKNCNAMKSSDVRVAADAPVVVSNVSSIVVPNDQTVTKSSECLSKGKHRCMFFIDEEELQATEEQLNDDYDDDDCTNGSGAGDSSNGSFSSHLSHREKQLLKYRKRMMKRDKKKDTCKGADDTRSCFQTCKQAANSARQQRHQQHTQEESLKAVTGKGTLSQPMEQGEYIDGDLEADDEAIDEDICAQQAPRHVHHSPHSSISACSVISSNTLTNVAMVSTGTQTQTTCCQCGSEKSLVCLNCDNCAGISRCLVGSALRSHDTDEMDSCSISSSDIIHTPRNKAELLLQAIQRTPKAAKKHKKHSLKASLASPPDTALAVKTLKMDVAMTSVSASKVKEGCQLCKRQKTQHNFGANSGGDSSDAGEKNEHLVKNNKDQNDDVSDVRVTARFNAVVRHPQNELHINDKECFVSSTKLTPHIDKCSLYNNFSNEHSLTSTPFTFASTSSQMAVGSECMGDVDKCGTEQTRSCTPPNSESTDAAAAQFKTPTNATLIHRQPPPQRHPHKQTPKPTLLQIATTYHGGAAGDGVHSNCANATPPSHNSLLLRKGMPKVNLTPIFCNPSATAFASSSCFVSAPIPISSCAMGADVNKFNFDESAIGQNIATINSCGSNMPVQKSFSAPTLPNSPSLSPRFAKQAAIYKRRSRHLSDRSDRSSLGSDEQFSDEELECGSSLYSPVTSPIKLRSRVASAAFGRRPLLGNLEEALLQRRLVPKIEVAGFKILLGASGGFCPTQLTIPAAAYFYELHGEALSTPYLCDIRLPRKGYSVPRAGTVQATLLNPMGTVVRMFVIAYDMRDMPPLHQTFIRQRVLAEASNNENAALGTGGRSTNSVGYLNGTAAAPEQLNGLGSDRNNVSHYNNSSNKYRLSPNGGMYGESNLGHFITAEQMKRLRYSIHLRFQTSRSGRLSLHTDIRLLISRRTDCDTAAAHAKGVLEAPNDLVTDTVMPSHPKYSARQESANKI